MHGALFVCPFLLLARGCLLAPLPVFPAQTTNSKTSNKLTSATSMPLPALVAPEPLQGALSDADLPDAQTDVPISLPTRRPIRLAPGPAPAPAPAPVEPPVICDGLLLDYVINDFQRISHPSGKAAMYNATVSIQNFGTRRVQGYGLYFNYANQDIMLSSSGLFPPAGVTFPATADQLLLSPLKNNDTLDPAIVAAGDPTLYTAVTLITGTEVGAIRRDDALPQGMNISHPEITCDGSDLQHPDIKNVTEALLTGYQSNHLRVCCNQSLVPLLPPDQSTSPQDGVEIRWDVLESSQSLYKVLVRITNHQRYRPIGGDGWAVTWAWTQDEFLWGVNGGEALDRGDCSFAPVAEMFSDLSNVHSCDPTPTIVDTSSRNGSLAAAAQNATLAQANFTMDVGRTTKFLGAKYLAPPENFTIGLPNYVCSEPVPVPGDVFPAHPWPTRQTYTSIVAYSVACKLVKDPSAPPACSVSFSAFWNSSGVASVPSCTCGCSETQMATLCDNRAPALPNMGAIMALGNEYGSRVAGAKADQHRCSDACPTAIHFHVRKDQSANWQAVVVVANQAATAVKDWLVVLQLPALPQLDQAYSVKYFNDTATTLLMFGFPFWNDLLLAEPGNIQSVLSFNKAIKGSKVPREAFPTKVIFQGEECAMPRDIPWSSAITLGPRVCYTVLGVLLALVIVL